MSFVQTNTKSNNLNIFCKIVLNFPTNEKSKEFWSEKIK